MEFWRFLNFWSEPIKTPPRNLRRGNTKICVFIILPGLRRVDIWHPAHLGPNSFGPWLIWAPTHLDPNSFRPRLIWAPTHLGPNTFGPQLIWALTHLGPDSFGPRLISEPQENFQRGNGQTGFKAYLPAFLQFSTNYIEISGISFYF